jgi:hypothetical protein
MTRTRWFLISIVSAVLVIFSIYRAFTSLSAADAAGWVQVLLAALGIPILYYELSQIRQTIDKNQQSALA